MRWRGEFQTCDAVIDSAELVAVYYLRKEYDCALLMPLAATEVLYDNRVRLSNLLRQNEGDDMVVQTWWTRLPEEAYGVSIQLFDQAGGKVAGSDVTIRHDRWPAIDSTCLRLIPATIN